MNKNKIIIVLLIMLSIGIVSLYTTYAYEEEYNNFIKEQSNANYNVTVSVKDNKNKEIFLNSKEETFIDISLKNDKEKGTIGYGTYYYMKSPEKLPSGVTIALAEHSTAPLEGTMKEGESKNISIKITNDSEYTINLIIGALSGLENGKIEDLPGWDNSKFNKIERG